MIEDLPKLAPFYRRLWPLYSHILTVLVFASGLYQPQFSYDSWSYWELSHNIPHDFYRINTYRQFEFMTDYGVSFPPLWPTLIAVARPVLNAGIYTSYILNFLIAIGIARSIHRLIHQLGRPAWIASAIWAAMLSIRGFQQELLAGMSIPLSLYLLVEMTRILIRPGFGRAGVPVIGLLCGLACLNRFDAILITGLIGCIIAVRSWIAYGLKYSVIRTSIFIAIVMALLSPWMMFNMYHFHKPFISDNSRQLHRAQAGHVTEYFDTPPVSDLKNDPVNWLKQLFISKGLQTGRRGAKSVIESALLLIGIACLATWMKAHHKPSTQTRRAATLAIVTIPLMIAPAWLVGYGETRYFVTSHFMIVFFMLLYYSDNITAASARRASLIVFLISMVPLLWASLRVIPEGRIYHSPKTYMETTELDQSMKLLQEFLKTEPDHGVVVLMPPAYAAKFGAISGERTASMPLFGHGTFRSFVQKYHVTHIYDPQHEIHLTNTSGVTLIPVKDDIYRVVVSPE